MIRKTCNICFVQVPILKMINLYRYELKFVDNLLSIKKDYWFRNTTPYHNPYINTNWFNRCLAIKQLGYN